MDAFFICLSPFFDDIDSIIYFEKPSKAYWKKDGKTIEAAIAEAAAEYDELMVRCEVQLLGQALEPTQAQICLPGQIPEDVQLRTEVYPVKLPVEAGEKPFAMEEDILLPPGAPEVENWIYYTLQPEVLDEKVDIVNPENPETEVQDGSIVFEKIRSSKKVGFGYNAYTETYADMVATGIVDPTKVTRSSLENAASIAGCVLTTESLVVDKPDPAADAAAAAAAAQGGMY